LNRDLKSQTNKKFKSAVQSTSGSVSAPGGQSKPAITKVTRVEIEESTTDTLLQTDCTTYMPSTAEEVADMVRRFTKAVAERPAK